MDGLSILALFAMLFPKTFAKHCALIMSAYKKAMQEDGK